MNGNNNNSSTDQDLKPEQNGISPSKDTPVQPPATIPDQIDPSSKDDAIKDSEDENKEYGWCSWHPVCLQWMNNALVFLILMTTSNIFQQGITSGLVGAVQTSIEARFQLTSTQSSTLMIAYECANVPIALFIAYIGTVGCHKPRWTSAFLFISCIGCLIHTIPHFTTPVYLPSDSRTDNYLCDNLRSNESSCDQNKALDSSLQDYLGVFIVSRICFAFGGVLLNLAVTYLDDSLSREKFSLYSSIFVLGGIFGPAMGYIFGGLFVELYTDFTTVDAETDLDFSQDDPRWVGAWWLGFLVFGAALLLVIIPMTGYPRDLPGAAEARLQKVNEAHGTTKDPSLTQLQFDFKLRDVKGLGLYLLTNWSWLFLSLFVACDAMIVSGLSLFAPKFLEVQYSMTSGFASIFIGALIVPAGAIGSIAAGLTMERLKLTYTSIVKIEFFTSIVVCLSGLMFIVTCKQTEFAGVNVPYPRSSTIDLIDPCNANCSCENQFKPVCSGSNIQYLSPCYAGCVDIELTEGSKVYHNCSCIQGDYSNATSEATSGICSNSSCIDKLAIFGVLLFLSMIGIFFCETMNLSAIIRVVPNSHRLFALVCTGLIVKLIGSVPGPILYGFVFDSACLLWQEDCVGQQGSCYHYDNGQVGLYMFITSTAIKVASVLFVLLAWKLYKPPTNSDVKAVIETAEANMSEMDVCDNNGAVNKTFEIDAESESTSPKCQKDDPNISESDDMTKM